MARSAVARKLVALGGDPAYREGVVTDNGNVILDVHNLNILNALELEKRLMTFQASYVTVFSRSIKRILRLLRPIMVLKSVQRFKKSS